MEEEPPVAEEEVVLAEEPLERASVEEEPLEQEAIVDMN